MSERETINRYFRAYRQKCEEVVPTDVPVHALRFVVFDSETSGLDEQRDSIVSLGAIAIQDGDILLDDYFEAIVQQPFNSASVLVHGVTREETARRGISRALAVGRFLDYIGDAVLVGHHVGFDCRLLNRIAREDGNVTLCNPALDTMTLALTLLANTEADEAQEGVSDDYSLDGLCRRFGIPPHDRHTASGDAFLTAQIFLKLLALAKRRGWTKLQDYSPSGPEQQYSFSQGDSSCY